MRVDFISNYQGCADYRISGFAGRCSIRYLTAEAQAFYRNVLDPQLLGTVVIGVNPAPQEILDYFQRWLHEARSLLPETKAMYVDHIVTAKWFQLSGWIRCEPAINEYQGPDSQGVR